WQYTLDAGDPVQILLPDLQEMRTFGRLLALKARAEVADGNFSEAVRTLETGFAFSAHVNEAPFLINNLVALSSANQLLDVLLELAERPDAPNLYWALATLPRPLIDPRRGYEFEQVVPELQFPDLADLDRKRSPEEWDAALKRLREGVKKFEDQLKAVGE